MFAVWTRHAHTASALERSGRSKACHAFAEDGVPYRRIAEAIRRRFGAPTRSLTQEEAEACFGGLAPWAGNNGPAAGERTGRVLGWKPKQIGIVADVERPDCSG